jgi:hypothetical protein
MILDNQKYSSGHAFSDWLGLLYIRSGAMQNLTLLGYSLVDINGAKYLISHAQHFF